MPVSKAQQRAVTKYMKENYDEFKVRLPKGTKDQIRAAADQQGLSINAWISRAIDETMKREAVS
jgi:predicted HicB family RNase H-like nuclease